MHFSTFVAIKAEFESSIVSQTEHAKGKIVLLACSVTLLQGKSIAR